MPKARVNSDFLTKHKIANETSASILSCAKTGLTERTLLQPRSYYILLLWHTTIHYTAFLKLI